MAVDLGGRERRSAAPVVIAAIAVGVLAMATVGALLGARGADRELRDARDDRATAVDAGSVDLVRALETERNYAGMYLLGMENAIDLDVASFGAATGATDEAVAGLGDGTPEGFEARLGEIRAAVTAPVERSLAATDTAEPVVADYTALIGGVLDADAAEALGIDDPQLRRGARLVDLSARQGAQVADAYRTSLLAAVAPVPTPESVGAQARGLGSVVGGATEIEGLATGPYAALAAEHLPDDDLATLVSALEAGLETSPGPVALLADSRRTADDVVAGYAAFGDGVQAAVERRADDLESDAAVRRLVMVALAVAAGAGALVAGVVLAVLLQRRASGPAAAG